MDMGLDISWKSLNKKKEELCGDTVAQIQTEDADILILSDGMGSGVKANILSTLTTKIMGTMLKNGATIEECVTTIASTLPVCQTRQVAYSTFSILKIFKDGEASLIEYDNPAAIIVRDGQVLDPPFTVREVDGKIIRDYRFRVKYGDYYVMMSDGVVHAGVGKAFSFGWGRKRVSEFVVKACQLQISAPRLMSLISEKCFRLYDGEPGDDTTVIVARVIEPKIVSLFTGPPVSFDDDETVMKDFMAPAGKKIVCGGTSSNIVARNLGKKIKVSLVYSDPEIPPTAQIEGMDLVTEGVLTLNRTVHMLEEYNSGHVGEEFFENLYAENGAARLARILIEDCTRLNLFVGQAMNPAHQAAGLPFDLSIRQRLVSQMIDECRKMGKEVTVKYY